MCKTLKSCALWVFLWPLRDGPASAWEDVLSCALEYAEAAGTENMRRLLRRKPAVARREKGKPYFPALPELHFSLSHSGTYGACAFSGRPVGLDLQLHVPCRREALARRFFHLEEYAYLQKSGFADFYRVWAMKESYLKYTGEGLVGGLNKFSVAGVGGIKRAVAGAVFYPVDWREAYSLCLCAAAIPGAIPGVEIRERGGHRAGNPPRMPAGNTDYLPNGYSRI